MSRVRTGVAIVVSALLLTACSGHLRWVERPSATPQAGAQQNRVTTVPTVLILDASGSMTTPDAPGPRIDAAKAASKGLVDALPDDARLGLVTYGTGTDSSEAAHDAGCRDVTTLLPVGPLDRNALASKIDVLAPSGYTPIGLALEQATGLLPTDGGPQAIVLVSDGEDTCGRPPCDIAAQLHRDHPGLSISTVGFRTDGPASEQLACIATATGGVFIQAANANQLAARLLATQNVQAAKATLTSTGFSGVDIGRRASEIRSANADFPDVASSGRVVVVWRDCDFTFVDGVLDSIAPHDGGRTIDGISSGSKVSDAVRYYGQPLGPAEKDSGGEWLTFLADQAAGAAYRMAVEGYGTGPVGTVTRIVLCRCMPRTSDRMTYGVVSFQPPDGWGPRESSGGTLTNPLVELAPSSDAKTSISVWLTDVSQDPSASLESLKQSGTGGLSTFGGKQVWTYAVNHTISSRGPEKYLLHWYYIFEGNYRVDVACDTLDDDQSQNAMGPICEKFVESLKIDAPASQPAPPPAVVTFEGYGPVKIGMTKDEAIAAMGSQVRVQDSHSCSQLTSGSLAVTVDASTGRVERIIAPDGATTDRGVGEGSTAQQIKDAYSGPEFTIDEGAIGGQGMDAVNVKNSSGQLISFGLDGGHADPPSVGQPAGYELCMG